jgi:hypothetical protein
MYGYTLSSMLILFGLLAFRTAFKKAAAADVLNHKVLPEGGKDSKAHHIFEGIVCLLCGRSKIVLLNK